VESLLSLLIMKVARFFLRIIHLIIFRFGRIFLEQNFTQLLAVIFSHLFEKYTFERIYELTLNALFATLNATLELRN